MVDPSPILAPGTPSTPGSLPTFLAPPSSPSWAPLQYPALTQDLSSNSQHCSGNTTHACGFNHPVSLLKPLSRALDSQLLLLLNHSYRCPQVPWLASATQKVPSPPPNCLLSRDYYPRKRQRGPLSTAWKLGIVLHFSFLIFYI